MTTKEQLIILLEKSGGEYLSGSAIAESLGITRSAIWKTMKQLKEEGYLIEAVTNKGYRLSSVNDSISENAIREFLGEDADLFTLEVCKTISSTNTILKEKAAELPDWYVLVAGNQNAGKGRAGRSFYSPEGTGVYLSVLLRPEIPVSEAGNLTTAAAIAACRAIEECTDSKPKIKWVNDVFVNEKKVCGILTEASVNFESQSADWIVTGIGFNVYMPEGGFPEALKDVAGSIVEKRQKNLRAKLAARFIQSFYELCKDLTGNSLYHEYKQRCFLIGEPIFVIKGEERIPATAIDIKKNFGLLVRYEDGKEEILSAGEVSVRPAPVQ